MNNVDSFALTSIKKKVNLTECDFESESISNNNRESSVNKFTLSWKDLCIWRTRKLSNGFWKRSITKKVQILNNVSGHVKSGDLLAIMGPSGSGKTTLLASISMRVQGELTGSILFNGQKMSRQFLSSISGFVPQQDLDFDLLTVHEHMEFMAKMKMDKNTNDFDRNKRISMLLNQLSLMKCYDTKLCNLSGGERKRLSLAVQLINDPPLLYCDEPTTGLDSWTAISVINHLRMLAASGKAIICSIHQPASGIVDLFSQVLLVAGGKVAFHGPFNEATTFFKKEGFSSPIGYNEAEFLVSIISHEDRAQKVCKAWSNAKNLERVEENEFHQLPSIENSKRFLKDDDFKYKQFCSIKTPGKLTQLYWLLWRSFLSSKRDNRIWVIEFLSLMGIAIIVALPYMNILLNLDQKDIQNVQGLMYLIVTEVIFMFAYSVFYAFPPEIGILLREVANKLYSPGPYYLSKILLMVSNTLVPKAIIESFLYTTIIFWVVGLDDNAYRFFMFTLPIVLAANCANAYGAWLSATFESIAMASMISVPIELISYTFSGMFMNLASSPDFLSWLKYLSIFYYPTEAISILQWEGVKQIKCDSRAGLPCIKTGAEVVDYLGYNINNYYINLLGIFVLFLAFHFFGFLSILRRSKKQPVY